MTLSPFRNEIPDERLALLRDRLRTTGLGRRADPRRRRLGLGVPGEYLRELVTYWLDEYDWRAQEAAMNRFPHVRGEIDSVTVHAIHERGSGPAPMQDSPVGLAAWMLQRRRAWSDCGGDVETRFTKDELLTTFSFYWLTNTFGGSVRF